ncbi:inosine triphosphate pyrophosphatase [Salpingoeca rosetta]|uniref:Inosine triphosphate pyrophosphatase n=1 Tax=Salpingoeca rosetta (strain ATCC 50818 / BSB-021) TaxID=946362 RepID=F2TVG5_SALR5|nr:inosine triphosphate pyrophosphatase [Salpingoeca rosetta]EGD72061.1 inosine triphosphate pyrophosphatase [Salpingoeca rosetta]|eukprot:XP_004998633.1 inosine triphosphate pyrophosphatase [Salpingoeca rosetta]
MSDQDKKPVLTFVTGNPNKLREVQQIVGDDFMFQLQNVAVDLPEYQGDPAHVAAEKCKAAYQQVKTPVIVEDTSLCFNALGGLPGVYIKWFLKGVGHDGLNKMLAGFDDKTAYAQCIFAFQPGEGVEPLLFIGRTDGKIVPARGPTHFGWDPVFQPDGFHTTYAEMESDAKNAISHRGRALAKMAEFFKSHAREVSERMTLEKDWTTS